MSLQGDLLQLVYVSSAAPALGADEIEDIAENSRVKNAALGLTGFLLHHGTQFYGVLEGPRRRVFARMEAIITDPRHRSLRILREEPIDTRRFDNWSFGSVPPPRPGVRGAPEDFITHLSRRLK